jgi:hypothetical protein
MRKMQEQAMPDQATVQRPTYAGDGRGGQTKTLTLIGTFPARLAVSSYQPGVRKIGEREVPSAYATITLPYGTDVKPGDEVAISGRTFLAGSIVTGTWETARQVLCSEVL